MKALVIGDTHIPWCHKDYLKFILDAKKTLKPDVIIHIGDEWDQCALSRFDKDPDAPGATDEYLMALEYSKPWYKALPNVQLVESNHGMRPFKAAERAGIPRRYLKDYKAFTEAPEGWKWYKEIILDKVLYFHGEGFSGEKGAYNAAMKHRMPVVIGHIHTHGGVLYNRSRQNQIFGLNVGCGIDEFAVSFKYAKGQASRPTLGCGFVEDGKKALFIPML